MPSSRSVLPADVLARVERVVVRHRQHLTGLGVEHDGGDVLGAGQVLGLLHLLLDVELDVVVDGELDGRPVDRVVAVAVAAGDHHAVGAAVVGDRAVGARQLRVERILEAEQPVAVPVDAADDVRGQRPARVLADVLPLGADLRVLGGDGVGDRGIDRTGQIDEGVLAGQLLQHVAASGLLFSSPATPAAISRSRLAGIRRGGVGRPWRRRAASESSSAGTSAPAPRW